MLLQVYEDVYDDYVAPELIADAHRFAPSIHRYGCRLLPDLSPCCRLFILGNSQQILCIVILFVTGGQIPVH